MPGHPTDPGRPPSPTRGLTPAFLADRGFAVPDDPAVERHYRRRLPGGLAVDVFFLDAGPRVAVSRGDARFEAKVGTEVDLDWLLDIFAG